jgi:thiamine pyrophosphokinase
MDIVVFLGDKKIFPVRSGFSKWQPAGEEIQILHEVHNLQTSGLRNVGDHMMETEKDGFYSLIFEQPFIFISESI